ncbi:MAG TPA: histidine triad nucleotide-binding protein [Acidobacteriota bacterium]|jgi:histidine triad (HIT) family protein|nr:histidine triad nucleotide-binding protein [Acidobacteriota bacterium]HRV07235.1 histidine triad nucleotide-binding protein [Acidobacteriota bacterium]
MNVFKKIADGEIPAEIVYQDDHCVAFRDINPQAPVHILLIPRREIPSLARVEASDHPLLGHLLLKAAEVAKQEGLSETGYRVVINCGPDAGQEVPHLHLHILGGRRLGWPPG